MTCTYYMIIMSKFSAKDGFYMPNMLFARCQHISKYNAHPVVPNALHEEGHAVGENLARVQHAVGDDLRCRDHVT